jgi:hypothetical protein
MKLNFIYLAVLFSVPARASSLEVLSREIEDSFREPIVYRGAFSGTQVEAGTFCDNRRDYSVFWEASVRGVSVNLSANGSASVKVEFDRSRVSASGWRQGGFLCLWSGGSGVTEISNAKAEFRLLPRPNGDLRVEADALVIGGLKFRDILAYLPLLGELRGDAPDWLNTWVETHANALSKYLLASSLRARVNDALSKRLSKALDDWRRGNAPLQDSFSDSSDAVMH